MLKLSDIINESNKKLRMISKEVNFPLSKEDKNKIKAMIEYLKKSQNEEYAKKNNITPGMGLAAIQIGTLKRFFVIVHEQKNKSFDIYVIINPRIISHSEEVICASDGEGCLSVNRKIEGIVPRYARITIEYYDEKGNKQELRVKEELAIAVQHEIDHLNGILFVDKIDPENPYKNQEKIRIL